MGPEGADLSSGRAEFGEFLMILAKIEMILCPMASLESERADF